MPRLPTLSRPFFRGRATFSVYDAPVLLGVFGLVYALAHVGRSMTAPAVPESLEISLGLEHVPYYLFRSTVRMFIAFGASLAFTFTYGSMAAHSRKAERILMPLLDVLQSVPVLGFLSVTVTAFMSLFPGSMLGMELAAIFAIFTSQAWNMAYSFFQSVRAIPRDLQEGAKIYRLTPFQRFVRLEIPFATNGLVWNSMVSFGGGWFFLAASEAITVLGKDIRLPGIGSYLATAVEAGDFNAIGTAIAAMLVVIVGLDVLFFRPLLDWAQKFGTGSAMDEEYDSLVLTALRRSRVLTLFQDRVSAPLTHFFVNRLPSLLQGRATRTPASSKIWAATGWVTAACAGIAALLLSWHGASALVREITPGDIQEVLLAGLMTLGRVLASVALASIVWVPIGTYVGLRPRLARRLRPIIQLGAAFPANLVFPLLVFVFIQAGVDIGLGSILLMVLATQWYILFNVIVGTMSIPEDLREVGRVLRLNRRQRFRNIILPVVLPYWVTGAITAAGGAWNVSIVAEIAGLGDKTLTCFGLGSYMTHATIKGDWPGIILSIVTMSLFVVATNRLLWRRLYVYAEENLRLET
ncbi:MAG: ABC transporter permease subunit [Deltaproteobacteria bacterium]|nr:ABC transporter permease subunit [Deltaproteobacteria bacterium]